MNEACSSFTDAQSGDIGVWLPTLRANTGADRFTERLAAALNRRRIRAEITWLPHRAEYLPWSVKAPTPPAWANITHTNPWLHKRFIPRELPCATTLNSCVHDPALRPYKSWAQTLYHRHALYHRERENLARASIVTAVSNYTAETCKKVFNYEDIVTIYNWIDTDTFVPATSRARHGPFRLLFVGSLRLLKGADVLPSIMERLGPGYELHFTGTLEELAKFGHLPGNLKPLGRLVKLDEVISAYQNSDALLFPTRLEGLSLVALEAMSCGLPIVASDIASLPELVTSGETGILCKQDDVDGFVNAIVELSEHPEATAKMAKLARQRAINEFSEAASIDRYISIYFSLVRASKPPKLVNSENPC